MTDLSYQPSLTQSGLTAHQAALYETLIKFGALPASRIALEARLSRPLAYKVLDDLVEIGLVEKVEKPRSVAKFSAVHPLKLKEIADKRFETAQNAKLALEGTIGKLISDFNLKSGKPGVQFFEGLDGIKQVLDDSLTAKDEIYAYGDLESIEKYIGDINRAYVREREKNGIKKRGFVFDTPFARKFLKDYAPNVTDTKLLQYEAAPFQTVMQIYDGKTSYITLSDQNLIGVIISDKRIYEMHRYLFLHLWSITPVINLEDVAQTQHKMDPDVPTEHIE